MIRIIALLILATFGIAAADLQQRVEFDTEALAELMQNERWAIIDAQNFAAKGHHQRAAVEFKKFVVNFPESELWGCAMYTGAWHLVQDRRYVAAEEHLLELIELGGSLPEVPEAMLLLGRTRLAAGDSEGALEMLRNLIETHPQSSAALPARSLLSQALLDQAKLERIPLQDIASARLGLLQPLLDRLDCAVVDAPFVSDGLRQLQSIVIGQEDQSLMTDTLERLIAGLKGVRDRSLRGRVSGFRDELTQHMMRLGANTGQDDFVRATAKIRWPASRARVYHLADFHYGWSWPVRGEPEGVAESRGTAPDDLLQWIHEQDEAHRERLVELLERVDPGEFRVSVGYLLARYRTLLDTEWPGIEATIDQGLAGEWSVSSGFRAFTFGIRNGVDPDQATSVVGRVSDERQRDTLHLKILEYRAKQFEDKGAAEKAIDILKGMVEVADGPARSELYRVASLYEAPLADWDAAIATYETINEPPRTDFAIAKCLGEKGDWKGAFNRYGMIHAMHADSGSGSSALLSMGKIAHSKLNDRTRAVQLLRKVCDDYPNTKHYSQAHVYLQHKLGVTYTGGGGGKKGR